jgi:NADH-quinone oxidoreductase subunit E
MIMTDKSENKLVKLLSNQAIKKIDVEISHYPKEQRQSAVMQALTIAQEECNHLTQELMDAIAEYLNMPAIAVYEVATFYTMYEHEPVGKNVIHVCRSISCHLRGSDKIVQSLESKLGIQCGETTSDGQFTLKQAECLGACIHAPMMLVNKDYHERLEQDKLDAVLEAYK